MKSSLCFRPVWLAVLIFCFSIAFCFGSERIPVAALSTGDVVYQEGTSVVVAFTGPRAVLSTSLFSGGYRNDLQAVFNHDMKRATGITADNYLTYLADKAGSLGLDPAKVSGMGTAASMENTVVLSESYQSLTVTAIATGGVEGNGGRVGDPTPYFMPGQKPAAYKPGTINIMLVIDADLPAGTLARALVTCTEAKTAALQELVAGSRFSTGLATGSGTDQTVIITNPGSELYLEDAGKHSKLGELIGRTVKQAVKEALFKQTGLSPEKQHSVLRRMNRFGVTEDMLYQQYVQSGGIANKVGFATVLRQVEREAPLVSYTSLYVHLLDQLQWQLLSSEEVKETGNALLRLTADAYGVQAPAIAGSDLQGVVQAWTDLVVEIMKNPLDTD
ncbi:adenosylcobinamide amidohydrolase [Anaerospora sp.]|uniref:adenosylcobinamide amidohydrolase n=1 Tax=Anaerospora sp. TaxID=1960278 RepID=UPI00289C534C|nr:adenosylcobinamide amidohydrolase [Anaerospora sp.]